MSLISIIVPVYNAEKFIKSTIESILKQTYKNFQLILINDGSTDNSLQIMSEFKDERIEIVNKKNTGVSDTRNVGIKLSKGKYITFIDSDDYIHPDYCFILLSEIKSGENIKFVSCNFNYDYDGKLIQRKSRIPKGTYNIEELKDNLIDDGTLTGILFGSACGTMYDLSTIVENRLSFEKNIHFNEDGIFNIDYLMCIDSLSVLSNEYLYTYRQYDDSSSKKTLNVNDLKNKTENATIHLYEKKYLEFFPNHKTQMDRRKVSELLWYILDVFSSNSIIYTKQLRDTVLIKLNSVNKKYYLLFDKDRIQSYKKIYLYLMEYNQVFILFILTKYIKPILEKRIKR